MSHKLIDHSPDLKRLRDEGYEVFIKGNYLLISSIPYVNPNKKIQYGTIVSELTLAGLRTGRPKNHVVFFTGDQPCHKEGSIITAIVHQTKKTLLAQDVEVDRSFSNKPSGGFSDYYQKMTSYIDIISAPALAINGKLRVRTFKIVEYQDSDSPFNYPDTNSSRAEISTITDRVKNQKIGIIGLGGTGSYVLDFISKTPVKEIHLFDDDDFLVHNAYRAPGAPSINTLNQTPKKVEYLKSIYSNMHKGIVPNSDRITDENLTLLANLDFVFICIDHGPSKRSIIGFLGENNISFVDSGMGIEVSEGGNLFGLIRTTSSFNGILDHIKTKSRISFSEGNEEDEYSQNIQIAELNALNAVLAIVKWKKHFGFYYDVEKENYSLYSIDDNSIINEDHST